MKIQCWWFLASIGLNNCRFKNKKKLQKCHLLAINSSNPDQHESAILEDIWIRILILYADPDIGGKKAEIKPSPELKTPLKE